METFETAAALYRRGYFEESLESLDSAIQLSPECGRSWELKGLVQRSIGEIALACDSLEHASLLVPLSVSGQLTLADCFSRLGKNSLALLIAQHLLARGKLDASLLLVLAHIFNRCNQPGTSVEVCRLASRKDPTADQTYFDLGHFLGRAGRPVSEIIAVAKQAIRLAPQKLTYRVGLASLLWCENQPDEAYEQVAALTSEQIMSLSCGCCLKKLVNIYWHAQAFAQSQACVDRLSDASLSTEGACR